jgi:hypothetical protein
MKLDYNNNRLSEDETYRQCDQFFKFLYYTNRQWFQVRDSIDNFYEFYAVVLEAKPIVTKLYQMINTKLKEKDKHPTASYFHSTDE